MQMSDELVTCYFCHLPVTERGGYFDCLCNHHISYTPELTVPAHISRHVIYHQWLNGIKNFTDWNSFGMYVRKWLIAKMQGKTWWEIISHWRELDYREESEALSNMIRDYIQQKRLREDRSASELEREEREQLSPEKYQSREVSK